MELNKGVIITIGLFVCLFLIRSPAFPQGGFQLPAKKKRDVIPFELVNNLVIIPVTLNGTKLSFLLDTGVDSTVLFSVDNLDTLNLRNTRAIRIKGLGSEGAVDAFLSKNNRLTVGEAFDNDHGLFMVMNSDINFSRRMGVPVHGILGYDFFSRFVVDINYSSSRLTIYRPDRYNKKLCRRCRLIPLDFVRNKPYVRGRVLNDSTSQDVVLLVDSGSSDGLWLFDDEQLISDDPPNYFNDFLGLGLSGSIFGKRTKLSTFKLSSFKLENVGTSIPDSLYISDSRLIDSRDGSLGGAILRRFRVVIDYTSSHMVLKPNSYFSEPFYYNMSGLVLEHDGLIPVKEVAYFNINPIKMTTERKEASGIFDVYKSPTLEFFLAPRFVVAEVRPGSPADDVRIEKGDEVVSINGKPSYKYKLYELNALFSSRAGKTIELKIRRNGVVTKKKFRLREVL